MENKAPWFWLSFADDSGFLGGCYVEADGTLLPGMEPKSPLPEHLMLARAIRKSHELGINPGGSVMSIGPIDIEELELNVPAEQRNVLLTKEDLKRIGGFANKEGELK